MKKLLTLLAFVLVAFTVNAQSCPDDNHPHMIDLGLPSGTKWACCNVDDDPSKQSPTNYGSYYAWGETEEKDIYNWDTYIYCDGSYDTVHYPDVDFVKWGGSWVMPSRDQAVELRECCTYEWTTMNGVNGGKFTSKANGGSIFLPAANSGNLNQYDSGGYYWSSTLEEPSRAYFFYFRSSSCFIEDGARYLGFSVRPVVCGPTIVNLQLSSATLTIQKGDLKSVEITSGSGTYTVESSDKNVATATIQNNTILITAVSVGTTIIVVTDAISGQTATIDVMVKSAPITFADASTKALCVGKWDTNGDGELSESEAAAVTSLGTTFKKSQIASFNELQYFTGLTSISDGAFSKSTVGAITLPENITSIGNEAFLDCKSLTSINIPSKVQTLGQNALSGCTAMTSITVDGSNTAFCDIDGVLFNKDKTTLIQFPAAKATAYDMPEGTKTIGRDAFYVSKLKTVTLPASLEELGFDAFGYSNSLEVLEIPEGVTTIGDYILDGCKNVKTLHIPSTMTSIGEYMCNGCNALTDVYCAMTTPLAIAKNNFTTTAYNSATLHVPAFAVDAYKDTEGWKYFQNIVGDMASNSLLADALTINVGKTENLLVNLSNSTEIDGVQFDIALPAGLDLFVDEEGDYEISTTTRSKKLTANCTKLSNGKYRFILFSTDRAIISAGEGAIMKIKLACATDAEAGIKEIAFSGISLSCVSGNVSVNQFCDDFTSMVTIKKVSDIQGDANGDFAVNITDVMEIVNYILDMTSRTFVFDNADVDRNGVVNITDVMNVVNLLLGNAIPDYDDKPKSYLTCPDGHHPHLIDLGLPSGTKWACCNMGATTPEDYGGHYAWGETEEKDIYNWDTYIYCDGSYDTVHYPDVDFVKWGGSWVMSSRDQAVELRECCTYEWTTMNGVNGGKFTSKANGGSIFLPAANSGNLNQYDSGGYYWSSTLEEPSRAYFFYFRSSSYFIEDGALCLGFSVRPVVRN